MLNRILPLLLLAMFPLDLIAGLAKGLYPSQATLMCLGGSAIGFYLARKLWRGGAARLEAQSRLDLVSELGQAFDPNSEAAQIRLEDARGNYLLGAGLLGFGVFLTLCFIGSYLVTTPLATGSTPLGRAVQLGIIIIFSIIVGSIEALGARVFLKR